MAEGSKADFDQTRTKSVQIDQKQLTAAFEKVVGVRMRFGERPGEIQNSPGNVRLFLVLHRQEAIMAHAAFDTLKFVEKLMAAGVPNQAKAIAGN